MVRRSLDPDNTLYMDLASDRVAIEISAREIKNYFSATRFSTAGSTSTV